MRLSIRRMKKRVKDERQRVPQAPGSPRAVKITVGFADVTHPFPVPAHPFTAEPHGASNRLHSHHLKSSVPEVMNIYPSPGAPSALTGQNGDLLSHAYNVSGSYRELVDHARRKQQDDRRSELKPPQFPPSLDR